MCWHYRQRLIDICLGLFSDKVQQRLAINTIVAFMPAAVIGVLVASYIKKWLFNPIAVATALVVGGVIILIVEYFQDKKTYKPRVETMDDMSWKDALRVGFLQCLAMIPGTSRSGATIIGGLCIGLSRKAATEFSFFLAIPTIFGATVYDPLEVQRRTDSNSASDDFRGFRRVILLRTRRGPLAASLRF